MIVILSRRNVRVLDRTVTFGQQALQETEVCDPVAVEVVLAFREQ